jgi:hypothetical protein
MAMQVIDRCGHLGQNFTHTPIGELRTFGSDQFLKRAVLNVFEKLVPAAVGSPVVEKSHDVFKRCAAHPFENVRFRLDSGPVDFCYPMLARGAGHQDKISLSPSGGKFALNVPFLGKGAR